MRLGRGDSFDRSQVVCQEILSGNWLMERLGSFADEVNGKMGV